MSQENEDFSLMSNNYRNNIESSNFDFVENVSQKLKNLSIRSPLQAQSVNCLPETIQNTFSQPSSKVNFITPNPWFSKNSTSNPTSKATHEENFSISKDLINQLLENIFSEVIEENSVTMVDEMPLYGRSGAYNVDWSAVDENADPNMISSKTCNSPLISRSLTSHSPPLPAPPYILGNTHVDEDLPPPPPDELLSTTPHKDFSTATFKKPKRSTLRVPIVDNENGSINADGPIDRAQAAREKAARDNAALKDRIKEMRRQKALTAKVAAKNDLSDSVIVKAAPPPPPPRVDSVLSTQSQQPQKSSNVRFSNGSLDSGIDQSPVDHVFTVTSESSNQLCLPPSPPLPPPPNAEEWHEANSNFLDHLQHQDFKEAALSRQSLYLKFDPLVAARESLLPSNNTQTVDCEQELTDCERIKNQSDLLQVGSPDSLDEKNANDDVAEIVVKNSPNLLHLDNTPLKHPAARALANIATPPSSPKIDYLINQSSFSPQQSSIPHQNTQQVFGLPKFELANSVLHQWNLDHDRDSLDSGSVRASPLLQVQEEDRIVGNFHQAINSSLRSAAVDKATSPHRYNSEKEMLKYSDSDVVKIKTEYQTNLLLKERSWEDNHRGLMEEKEQLRAERDKLLAEMAEMKNCVLEYERTMQQMIAAKAQSDNSSKHSVEDVIAERDQAVEELQSIEKAFTDLHRRFEKSKQVIDAFKSNEETLKNCVAELQNKLKRQEQRYQTLKTHAEEKIDQANQEIIRLRKSSEAEIKRLQAAMRKSEMQIHSLEAQLEQKKRDNEELANICDELIKGNGVAH